MCSHSAKTLETKASRGVRIICVRIVEGLAVEEGLGLVLLSNNQRHRHLATVGIRKPLTEQHWLPVIWLLDEGNQENTTPRAQDKKECSLVVAIETRLRFGRAPLIASAQRLFARDSNLVQDGGGILSY